ncbi:MAG: PHP domain-containing protein [Nocardioidaceae bacterium]|nr:PHP domain-containing protein [Nocardioidaceae bacterium]
MRVDLHTHSHCSDGTDSPAALVRAAAAAGLDVVALTDHDVADGWSSAAAAAADAGIGFVPGMEVSCTMDGSGVHLLAYGVDPTHPPLADELQRVLDGRNRRLPATVDRLRALGIDIDEAAVRAVAGPAAALGRPHVADALVQAGVVVDRRAAFVRYLMPGRPAYVSRYAAPLRQLLDAVADAGGVSVLAHPWGRGSRTALGATAVAELARLGLTGLEVWHRDQSERDSRELYALARDLGQVAIGSSDYHGLGKVDHELGCHTTPPEQFERLLAAMAAAAGAARAAEPSVQPSPAVLR